MRYAVRMTSVNILKIILSIEYCCDVVCVIVQISCSQCHKHVKVLATYDVKHILLAAEFALYVRLQVLCNKSGGDAFDGKFSCWVYIHQCDVLHLRESAGELLIKIAGARV